MNAEEKKRNYLDRLVGRVSGKKLRKEIRREFSSHIDCAFEECLGQYTEEEKAMEEALRCLGNPEELGREMNAVYNPSPGWKAYGGLALLFLAVFHG